MPQYTIEELDGSKRTITWDDHDDPNWLKKREAFCAFVAHGMPPAQAYLAAYHAEDDAVIPIKTLIAHARDLMLESDIVLRIHQLKQKVARKVTQKFEFNLQKAMEECDKAYNLAYLQGNAPAMLKATELKAKLNKMLADQVDVNHRHGFLDDASTEILLEMKREFEKKKARLEKNTVTVVAIEDKTERHETPLAQ